MAMFHLLKIKLSIDIFSTEKSKVIFGFKYIYVLSHIKLARFAI